MKKISLLTLLLFALLTVALVSGCTKKYTITFIAYGSEYAKVSTDGKSEVPLPQDPSLDGYRFLGWFFEDGIQLKKDTLLSRKITANVTVEADWKELVYFKVTFNPGSEVQVEKGEKVDNPGDRSREGYTFLGWYNGEEKWNFETDKVTKAITLTPRFLPNTYTITYDPDGGTVGKATQEVLFDSGFTLEIPTNDAYEFFGGWYYGTRLLEDGVWDISDDVTLVAHWTNEAYKITYEPNGGTVSSLTQMFYCREGELFNPLVPVKGLYYFDGWYYDEGFSEVFDENNEIFEDFTLYAKWIDPVNVTLVKNNGEADEEVEVMYKSAAVMSAVTRSGYSFEGWFLDDEFTVSLDTLEVFTEDLQIFAYWLDAYSVHFDLLNGETFTVEVVKGRTLSKPADPKRAEYRFEGWYTEDNEEYDFGQDVRGEFTLYAKWTDLLEEEFISQYLRLLGEVPRINLTTDSGKAITSKDTYVPGKITVETENYPAWNLDNYVADMRGRGSSSWYWWEKKSYRIKLEKKSAVLLGMTGSKHYNLISNMNDRSFMRNYLAYLLGRTSDNLGWNQKCYFVELSINTTYQGLYMLTEAIRAEDVRVDLSGQPADVNDSGFLVEQTPENRVTGLPSGYSGDKFITSLDEQYVKAGGFWWEVKSPERGDFDSDNAFTGALDYAISYLNTSLNAIFDKNRATFLSYCDEDSFIDFWLVQELFSNFDNMQASVYFYKAKGGKLTAGPLWDFDVGANNIVYRDRNSSKGEIRPDVWYNEAKIQQNLLLEPVFFAKFKERGLYLIEHDWKYMLSSIELVYEEIKDAAERNYGLWPIDLPGPKESSTPNGKIPVHILEIKTFRGQVDFLYNWLSARLDWMKYEFSR